MHTPNLGRRGRLYSGAAALAVTAGLAVAPSAFANGVNQHHHPFPPPKPPVHHHHHHHHQKPPFRHHKP